MKMKWWTWLSEKKLSFLNFIVASVGVLIAMCAIILSVSLSQEIIHDWLRPPRYFAQAILNTNYVGGFANSKEYVHHPLERSLSKLLGSEDNQYVVVVGPKGCGKSTLVKYITATNPTGIIPVKLNSNFIDLYGAISRVLGSANPWTMTTIKKIFNSTVNLARHKEGVPSDWVPTVVVEVDRTTTDDSVRMIARDVKLLCSDSKLCKGFLVLSDALAAFALPKDPRVDFFWLDDFTESAAHQYFDILHYLDGPATVVETSCGPVPDSSSSEVRRTACHREPEEDNVSSMSMLTNYSLRAEIFSTIGTRVMDLDNIAKKTGDDPSPSHIGSYLNSKVKDCETTLKSLFNFKGRPSGLDFKEVARLILLSPSKSVEMVDIDENNELVNPPLAATVLKQFHGMLYHIPSNSYRFYSKCHEIAANRYLNK